MDKRMKVFIHTGYLTYSGRGENSFNTYLVKNRYEGL